MRIVLFYISVIFLLGCSDSKIEYDEIQLLTYTDTSSIHFIINSDSIIFYEIQMESDGRYGFTFGPNFGAFKAKDEHLWNQLIKPLKIILSDTFNDMIPRITHASSSELKMLKDDSLLKDISYYEMADDSPVMTEVGRLINLAVQNKIKTSIDYKQKIFDLSLIKIVDSITIIPIGEDSTSLIPYKSLANNKMLYHVIKTKNQINSIRNQINTLEIVNRPFGNESNYYANAKFKLHFYRGRLLKFSMISDGNLISYNEIQWLKIDSTFINLLK